MLVRGGPCDLFLFFIYLFAQRPNRIATDIPFVLTGLSATS